MNVFIDDVIRKLLEMKSDGYSYCEINLIPADDFDGETLPAWVSFMAIDGGEGIDYCDNEDTDVYEVSDDELDEYAYRNHKPAPDRKQIKKITISD